LKGGEKLANQKKSKTNNTINTAYAFNTSFTAKLNPIAIDDYTEFFTSIGVPSASKLGCVFDIIHAYPMFNGNAHGFVSDVLKKSANSFLTSLIDINHDRSCVAGSIVKVDLIENDVSPLTVRLAAVLDKQILADWGIENLLDEDWSMECKYNNYLYSIGSRIYQPSELPDIDKQFKDISEGKPVYDKLGNRVCLLLGGSDETIDFNRCGLIIWGEGADPLAQTHYQVASKLNNKDEKQTNNEGSESNTMAFKEFLTEADYNAAISSIVEKTKNDYKNELKFDELSTNLQTATATLLTKDTEITDLSGKLKTAEASALSEKERADIAESKLQAQATAALIIERKQILASKQYPEDRITKKEEWLGKASKEDFDNFIEEVDALFATANKTLEAKASQLGVKEALGSLFNLTAKTSEGEGSDESNKEQVNLFA
jgi:hypothetical protein